MNQKDLFIILNMAMMC